MQRLLTFFGDNLVYSVTCNETHEDGAPHCHAVVGLEKTLRTRDPSFLDGITGKHPNLVKVKSPLDAIRYVKKGGKFMEYGEVPQSTAERKRKRGDEICEMLEAGKSMRDVYMADRGFYMRNKSHIHSMKHELDMWSHEDGMKPIEQIQLKYRRDPDLIYQDRVIVSWLVKNLCMKRPFKAKQLFITGPPDVGKTHLVNYLSEFLRVYHIPANEDFYDHYTDDVQLCVLDEFKAQKTVQWMNEFLQGSLMSLRKKGSQYLKRSNPPVIILSNYTLEDCYKNQDSTRLESLKCRLLEVHVYQRIEIYDLPEAGHSPGNTKISTDLPPTPQLGDSTPIWNTGPVRMDYEVLPLDHIPFYDD